MQYISLVHALNLPCALKTCGDWHCSGLQWKTPNILNTENSIFEDYGIEKNRIIPEHTKKYNVANHIRALLDLLYLGMFSVCQGMNKDFICNSEYDNEIFRQVIKMINCPNWEQIDKFMTKEYLIKWVNFKNYNK